MEEIVRIIERLDASREHLRRALADWNPGEEIYPGWKTAQLVAHIAGWDELITRVLQNHAQGKEERIPWEKSIDEYNQQFVLERAHLTPAQAIVDWENARDRMKRSLLEIPAEKVSQRFLPPWGEETSVKELMEIFIHHDDQHAAEMEKKRAG